MSRKIDDRKLMEMIESGKTQKACADFFGVDPSAICQRVKKLRMPESFKKLTDKQKSFALARVEGKSPTQAAMEAYDVSTRASGKSLGLAMTKDPDICKAIEDLLFERGLSRAYRIDRLKWLMDHPDPGAVARGLDMANKMTGDYAPVKVDQEIDVRQVAIALSAQIAELEALLGVSCKDIEDAESSMG